MRVVVVGGGGTIGRRIVRETLDRGHRVTLVARDPSRTAFEHERLAVVAGDVLDPALADVLGDHDVVVSAVGTARAENPDASLYLRAAHSLVDALDRLASRAPRLVVVGGAGSLRDSLGWPLLERVPEERRDEHLGQKAALDFDRHVTDVAWTRRRSRGTPARGSPSAT